MVSIPPPEVVFTDAARVHCDGDVDGIAGHPRVFLQIDERGYVDCGYCDRRFILAGGPAETRPGIAPARGGGDH
ncbi:MAG: zinc-finger domain-containing protein [Polymorphobacter sp.]